MAWPTASARSKNWGTEVLTDTELEQQFDILHTYFNDSLNGTTGHDHSGGTSEGPKIVLTAAAGVSGTLPIANGGTGVTTLAALGNLFYPVGSIYMNDEVSTNPGTLLGFGTWTAITGKMIIGVDSGDTSFDTAKETGGAKTVTLTTTELPAHTHQTTSGQAGGGSNTGSQAWSSGLNQYGNDTSSTGSGAAFSIMNPYYAAYIWRRSA